MPRGRPRKNPEEVLMRGAEMIGWALGGLEREIMLTKERLSTLTSQAAQLRAKLPGSTAGRGPAAAASFDEPGVASAGAGRQRRRRRMSPEARKRISEMMKKRWAERRKK
jgi:hypothetical protein